MTKEKANLICEQINTDSFNRFDAPSVDAQVVFYSDHYEVLVTPSDVNDDVSTFYHVEYLGILVAGYGVSSYIKFDTSGFKMYIY